MQSTGLNQSINHPVWGQALVPVPIMVSLIKCIKYIKIKVFMHMNTGREWTVKKTTTSFSGI
jgi:hypothetical protein